MSRANENKAIARREIEEFEGDGRLALGSELFAPDYELTFGGYPATDRAGHEHMLATFREGFPDLNIKVALQVAADDRVANHWVAHGTHRGAFQGIPATGKAVKLTGNNLMHIEGGRIRALWGQLDAIGLMGQLGVMPEPPAASAGKTERTPAPGSASAAAASKSSAASSRNSTTGSSTGSTRSTTRATSSIFRAGRRVPAKPGYARPRTNSARHSRTCTSRRTTSSRSRNTWRGGGP